MATIKAKPARKQMNFRLDGPTIAALVFLSEKEKRSQAQIIELAVEEYFIKHHEAELMRQTNANDNQA